MVDTRIKTMLVNALVRLCTNKTHELFFTQE